MDDDCWRVVVANADVSAALALASTSRSMQALVGAALPAPGALTPMLAVYAHRVRVAPVLRVMGYHLGNQCIVGRGGRVYRVDFDVNEWRTFSTELGKRHSVFLSCALLALGY